MKQKSAPHAASLLELLPKEFANEVRKLGQQAMVKFEKGNFLGFACAML